VVEVGQHDRRRGQVGVGGPFPKPGQHRRVHRKVSTIEDPRIPGGRLDVADDI
jgi:hypothetical protein